MASIAKCPKCEAAVLISAEVDSYGQVRCPNCQADYPLQDVAQDAVPLPPEFMPALEGGTAPAEGDSTAALAAAVDSEAVVDMDADWMASPAPEEAGASAADETEAAGGVGLVEESEAAAEPTDQVNGGESEVDVAERPATEDVADRPATDEEEATEEPAFATDEEEEQPGEEASVEQEERPSEAEAGPSDAIRSEEFVAGVARLWNLAPASAAAATGGWPGVEGATQFDFGGGLTGVAEDHSGFAIHTGEEAEGERAAVPGARLPTRRKRKKKSALREMIEVVVGGFAGLAIGYFLLNLISGNPQFDFLKIPLPWVQHTYKHAPEWWPWKAESDSQEGGAEEEGQTLKSSSEPNQSQPKAKRPAKPRNEPEEEAPDIDPGEAPPIDAGPGFGGLGGGDPS